MLLAALWVTHMLILVHRERKGEAEKEGVPKWQLLVICLFYRTAYELVAALTNNHLSS